MVQSWAKSLDNGDAIPGQKLSLSSVGGNTWTEAGRTGPSSRVMLWAGLKNDQAQGIFAPHSGRWWCRGMGRDRRCPPGETEARLLDARDRHAVMMEKFLQGMNS